MAEKNPNDTRVEILKRRLQEDLIDTQGQPPEPDDVSRVVDAKVESLAHAPVQDFVPLLVEHQARDELRQQGLHRDLGDETGHAPREKQAEDHPAGSMPRGRGDPA
jgi:hypothetical protein